MEQKVNVLVVDDEQIVLDSIRRLVRNETYSSFPLFGCRSVGNNETNRIDFVLTDLMMPGIDGLEFMQMLKCDYPRCV